MITQIFKPGYPTKTETEVGSSSTIPDMDIQKLPFQAMWSGYIRVTSTQANIDALAAYHINWAKYGP